MNEVSLSGFFFGCMWFLNFSDVFFTLAVVGWRKKNDVFLLIGSFLVTCLVFYGPCRVLILREIRFMLQVLVLLSAGILCLLLERLIMESKNQFHPFSIASVLSSRMAAEKKHLRIMD